MARVNRIASNKPKLEMVLLCIPSQFGFLKFSWFRVVEFGLVWLSSFWCGQVGFGAFDFCLVCKMT